SLAWKAHNNPPKLDFRFPKENSPLTVSQLGIGIDAHVELYLPADLSPYGVYWRTSPEQVGDIEIHHLYSTYSSKDPRDDAVNQKIDEWALTIPDCTTVLNEVEVDSGAIIVHAIALWGFDYLDSVNIDFSTGQIVN
ncbi:MAG: hypothetical protein FWG16_06130, partial [Micrococcales bacterium]|nr:hypothetical protein [Micrococcales bacterium]